ncbi:hypothetical protein ACSSS7_002867 [Eimeria intestinalis]
MRFLSAFSAAAALAGAAKAAPPRGTGVEWLSSSRPGRQTSVSHAWRISSLPASWLETQPSRTFPFHLEVEEEEGNSHSLTQTERASSVPHPSSVHVTSPAQVPSHTSSSSPEKRSSEDSDGIFAKFKRLLTGKNVGASVNKEEMIAEFAETQQGTGCIEEELVFPLMHPLFSTFDDQSQLGLRASDYDWRVLDSAADKINKDKKLEEKEEGEGKGFFLKNAAGTFYGFEAASPTTVNSNSQQMHQQKQQQQQQEKQQKQQQQKQQQQQQEKHQAKQQQQKQQQQKQPQQQDS